MIPSLAATLRRALILTPFLCAVLLPAKAQPPTDAKLPRRIHLILKDGSYQLVISYKISGKVVHYISAERGGEEEDIPVDLVDLEATHRWEKQHAPVGESGVDADTGKPPALDPELVKEEQERAALTPTVAPDLRLPEDDSVLALDFYQGTPELVPLVQTDGDLNHTTSHSIVPRALNPKAHPHPMVTLRRVQSYMQLHVDTPVFYLRVTDDAAATGGTPLVVDTHGASSVRVDGVASAGASRYVVLQADVRTDARVLDSFRPALLGGGGAQADVIEMKREDLPGGHWIKLTPARPLNFGEFALVEVLSERQVNLGVWDFGVHPTAPENRDALKPVPQRPASLDRRRP
jgi:hypothetical protein